MGLRAYLLLRANDETDQESFSRGLLELEDMPEVDFVDPVVGSHDVVIMIEAPVSVDAVAKKVEALEWVGEIEILRIVSIFERQRASKRELLKAMRHEGV
jgi:hypothetical protein